MLASDADNKDFVGAKNPDDGLFVEFYMHKPLDWNKKQETGKNVYLPEIPYVRVQVPGDKTSVLETPVTEVHKSRWPQKWLYFQMKEGLIPGDADLPGWRIEEWDYLNPDQVRELKFMRFSIVEQIAGASDAQVQRIGMNGVAVREAAKQALRDRMGAETRAAMDAKDKELATLRLQQQEAEKKAKEQEERLARLEALLSEPQNAPTEKPSGIVAPKKRGRPRKNPEAPVTTVEPPVG